MDTISFRILINLVDWICAYLYELLNIPKGFKMPETYNPLRIFPTK